MSYEELLLRKKGWIGEYKRKCGRMLTALLVIMTTMLSGCAGCNDDGIPATRTSAITVTVAPIEKSVKTSLSTMVGPMEEMVSVTPTPLPEPTSETTAVPVSMNTPIPTVAVVPEAKLLDSVKMGEKVWYDFYDDGTLVVRGTGKTRSFENAKKMYSFFVDECSLTQSFSVTTIIIEEGITEVGQAALSNFTYVTKIFFPLSLECLRDEALSALGYASGNVEYIGLNVDKVNISSTAFAYCSSREKIQNSEKYTVIPTSTPLPTATPLPDLNKPRKYATKQMGEDVIFEFWDNGYLYVKGKGATWDKDWSFCEFRDAPYKNTQIIVVEEGITYLGDHCFAWLEPQEIYFPESLSRLGNIGTWATIHGVRGGRKYVVTGGYIYHFFNYFEDESLAKKHGCVIAYE